MTFFRHLQEIQLKKIGLLRSKWNRYMYN